MSIYRLMNIREYITALLEQRRKSLAEWSEGRACDCWIAGHEVSADNPLPNCEICKNTRYIGRGFCVLTEPDPEARKRMRLILSCLIEELEIILRETRENGEKEILTPPNSES